MFEKLKRVVLGQSSQSEDCKIICFSFTLQYSLMRFGSITPSEEGEMRTRGVKQRRQRNKGRVEVYANAILS